MSEIKGLARLIKLANLPLKSIDSYTASELDLIISHCTSPNDKLYGYLIELRCNKRIQDNKP